jgi:hypothetical protein
MLQYALQPLRPLNRAPGPVRQIGILCICRSQELFTADAAVSILVKDEEDEIKGDIVEVDATHLSQGLLELATCQPIDAIRAVSQEALEGILEPGNDSTTMSECPKFVVGDPHVLQTAVCYCERLGEGMVDSSYNSLTYFKLGNSAADEEH